MKIFRNLKLIAVILATIMVSSTFVACGGSDDDEQNEWNSSNGNGDDSSSDPTYELVKKNISASVSYGDYSWNISIKSKLASAFPGKSITYGVESGYGDYQYYEHFKFNNSNQKNDGNGNITVSYPVFVGDEYSYEGFTWIGYKGLKEKKANGESLNSDERDLWNEIVKVMNAKESKAKSTYCGRLYAQFDNKRYIYIIHLVKSHHLAQPMAVEVLTMMVVRVEVAPEVPLHTRNQTLPLTISLLTKPS